MNIFSDMIARFMPHGACLYWDTAIISKLVIGDAGTFVVYMVIAGGLGYLSWKAPIVLPRNVALMFAPFIFFCGVGHLIDVVDIWWPIYPIKSWSALLTFAVSIPAAMGLSGWMKKLIKTATALQVAKVELSEAEKSLLAALRKIEAHEAALIKNTGVV